MRTGEVKSAIFALAAACLLTAAGATSAATATTPFVAAPRQSGYPEGSGLRENYKLHKGGSPIEGVQVGMQAHSIAKAAASRATLPKGFSLKEGATTRIVPGLGAEKAVQLGSGGDLTEAAPVAKRGVLSAEGASGEALPESAKIITLHPIEYQGIPLAKGSDYLTVATGSGKLLASRERGIPDSVDATSPRIGAEDAVAVAKKHGGSMLAQAVPGDANLEIWVGKSSKGRLSWSFELRDDSSASPVARRYWVAAAGSPQVLAWENLIYHTHFGTATGTIWSTSPVGAKVSQGLPDLRVDRGADQVATSDSGRYAFPTGTGLATIASTLRGPFSAIQNIAGPVMTVSQSGSPGSPIDLNFAASTEFELAQTSAFYWTNFAHRLAGLAPTELAALPTKVNMNSTCNAYWDGSSINFFRAGGGCPNTAYSDVVLHEYGHGIDSAKGGILDGGYSEGFGDAVAVLGTRQSCAGRDFFGAGTCLRPASAVILWPPPPGEEVHAVGRRYAGFVWELVQQLQRTYGADDAFEIAGQLVLASAAANPANIPDAVRLSFIADDTDGNLLTCSPHQKELAAAADSRHIPRPPDCALPVAIAPGATAQFPWTPVKVVPAGTSNIASVQIHLDAPMQLHIVASSSAQVTAGNSAFRTGFYNVVSPSTMWTNSLRAVSLPRANEWTHFGSTFAIDLPAGDHTIYWKGWVTGSQVSLSGGTLLLEGFTRKGGMAAVEAIARTSPRTDVVAEAPQR